ncbi:MAG: type II toxin-antitoxin system prevent-host-death family antitoxin [Luteitalea sp.]|nr:type II toxin-antitoxin system prevent-host-death family antitoxin [Luteitalea sp.]
MNRSTQVGAREFKTRLGRYLRKVREGRTLVVTDRGTPIAEIRPLGVDATPEDAALARLKAIGAVTQLEEGPLTSFRPMRSRGASVSDAIIEDRADRL